MSGRGAGGRGAVVIKGKATPVKVLGDGDLTKALTVHVDKISAPARAKIEAVGGTVDLT